MPCANECNQARAALHEFERQQKLEASGGGAGGSPALLYGLPGGSPGAPLGFGGSPLAAHISASGLVPQVRVRPGALNEASPWKEGAHVKAQTERAKGAHADESPVDADDDSPANIRKTGSNGVLGWMWSQFGATSRAPEPSGPSLARPGSRSPGLAGPFTA